MVELILSPSLQLVASMDPNACIYRADARVQAHRKVHLHGNHKRGEMGVVRCSIPSVMVAIVYGGKIMQRPIYRIVGLFCGRTF